MREFFEGVANVWESLNNKGKTKYVIAWFIWLSLLPVYLLCYYGDIGIENFGNMLWRWIRH